MKKTLLAVTSVVVATFAAACGGSSSGAHGTFFSGKYAVSGAVLDDGCHFFGGVQASAFDTSNNTLTVNGDKLQFMNTTFTGGPSVFVYSTSSTTTVSATCTLKVSQDDRISADGNDQGSFHLGLGIAPASGSSNCSSVSNVPCSSSLTAHLAMQ